MLSARDSSHHNQISAAMSAPTAAASPIQRVQALLAQLAPATPQPLTRFPGCASVLDVSDCAAATAVTATAAAAPSLPAEGARLAGRVALITGAGSGIGRASALQFAQQGASLFLVDLALEDSLNDTLRAIASAVPSAAARVALHTADVTDEGAAQRMVDACVARFGVLHVFFANAGVVGALGGMEHISSDSFARTLAVNVVAVFSGFQAAAAHIRQQGPDHRGSLLCTSSVAGLRSGAGGVDYSASKAALISMVQTVANELAGTNIRVNAICPGLVETGMTRPLFDHARQRHTESKIGQLNPLRRAGLAAEVASVALFLASDDAAYVNGQAIAVDGGLSSSLPVMPPRAPKPIAPAAAPPKPTPATPSRPMFIL